MTNSFIAAHIYRKRCAPPYNANEINIKDLVKRSGRVQSKTRVTIVLYSLLKIIEIKFALSGSDFCDALT